MSGVHSEDKIKDGTSRRRGALSGLNAGVGSVLVPQPPSNSWAGGSRYPQANDKLLEPTSHELLLADLSKRQPSKRRKAAIAPELLPDSVVELLQGFEMLTFPVGEEVVEIANFSFVGTFCGAGKVLDGA